eukprot:472411-Heterocapsa_arctica.AAC.1
MVEQIGMAVTGGDNRVTLGALAPIEGAARSSWEAADPSTYLPCGRGAGVASPPIGGGSPPAGVALGADAAAF